MSRSHLILCALSILLAVALAGCGNTAENPQGNRSGQDPEIVFRTFSDPCKEARFYSRQMQKFIQRREEPTETGRLIREFNKSGERCEEKIGIGPRVGEKVTQLMKAKVDPEDGICALSEAHSRFSCLFEKNGGSGKLLVEVDSEYTELTVVRCEARKGEPCEGLDKPREDASP